MMRKTIISIQIFLVIIFALTFESCEGNQLCCANIDTNVVIYYKNQEGLNLINSSPDFAESKIKIYYKDGDKYKLIYRENLDIPGMFRVIKDDSTNVALNVFPSDYYTEKNQSTTLIELNPNVVDTLVCTFDFSNNNSICTEAWLNGVKMDKGRSLIVKR
jgi:hypothetical protein